MASNSISSGSTSNGSTQIGRGTTIRGSVRGSGDVDVDGRVEGVVDVDGDVSLSESARVRIEDGALSGKRVSVRGAVAGNIRGNAAIVLEDGARVVGDLAAPTIGIRPGGLLRGHVTTGDAPESQALTKGRIERPTPARAARPAATSGRGRSYAAAPAPRASSAGAVVTQRTAEPASEPVTPPAARGSKREAAPAPVMPVLRKGQRGQMKRKNGR